MSVPFASFAAHKLLAWASSYSDNGIRRSLLTSRSLIVVCVLLGALILGSFAWQGLSSRRQPKETSAPIISKQPVAFTNRPFDPAAAPPDMPPLALGESAECDSNFMSNASVRGE